MEEHTIRKCINPGSVVLIAVKKNGKYQDDLVYGEVKDILTKSKIHHRGIKVRLTDGTVGRVQKILV